MYSSGVIRFIPLWNIFELYSPRYPFTLPLSAFGAELNLKLYLVYILRQGRLSYLLAVIKDIVNECKGMLRQEVLFIKNTLNDRKCFFYQNNPVFTAYRQKIELDFEEDKIFLIIPNEVIPKNSLCFSVQHFVYQNLQHLIFLAYM